MSLLHNVPNGSANYGSAWLDFSDLTNLYCMVKWRTQQWMDQLGEGPGFAYLTKRSATPGFWADTDDNLVCSWGGYAGHWQVRMGKGGVIYESVSSWEPGLMPNGDSYVTPIGIVHLQRLGTGTHGGSKWGVEFRHDGTYWGLGQVPLEYRDAGAVYTAINRLAVGLAGNGYGNDGYIHEIGIGNVDWDTYNLFHTDFSSGTPATIFTGTRPTVEILGTAPPWRQVAPDTYPGVVGAGGGTGYPATAGVRHQAAIDYAE